MFKFTLSRDKRGLSFVVVCLILAFLGLSFGIFNPRDRYGHCRTPQRNCYMNIRVLQSAVEMYNMDYTPMMQNLNADILLKKGYMKKMPACPDVDMFSYASVGDLSVDGKVFCYRHGLLDGELKNPSIKLFQNDPQKGDSLTPNGKRVMYAVLGSIICFFGMIYAFSGYGKKKKDLHEDQSENQPEDFAEAPTENTSENTSEDIME